MSGRFARGAGAARSRCWLSTPTGDEAVKGTCPVINWYRITDAA
jgi:hypothetical protein